MSWIKTYPSEEALWSAECFAPLQEWVAAILVQDLAIKLHTTKGGSTCASLVLQKDELNERPKVCTDADGALTELIPLDVK